MNYTQNYHLPQWEENDRVMRTDFNSAMAALEDGLTDNAETAAKALELPYATGTYTGNGDTISIQTGFRPRFLIVSAQDLVSQDYYIGRIAIIGESNFQKMVSFHSNSFSVKWFAAGSGTPSFPRLNAAGTVYNYIAFR